MRMSTFLWAVYQLGMLHKLHFSGCQLWGRISFVQLWRLGKSSTTFRCTLLKTSKYKEDFLCLLTPPQTFTGVAVNWSRISFVQECQCQQLDLFIVQLSLSLKLSLSPVWLRAPAEYPLNVQDGQWWFEALWQWSLVNILQDCQCKQLDNVITQCLANLVEVIERSSVTENITWFCAFSFVNISQDCQSNNLIMSSLKV